jgi:L-alanine-DL-glutamate epimerase-like enolase superfamily enzyme
VTEKRHICRVHTNVGLVGEYAGGSAADYATLPRFASYLIGRNAIGEKGHVPMPQGPGLGVQIDWDWVEQRQTCVVEYA